MNECQLWKVRQLCLQLEICNFYPNVTDGEILDATNAKRARFSFVFKLAIVEERSILQLMVFRKCQTPNNFAFTVCAFPSASQQIVGRPDVWNICRPADWSEESFLNVCADLQAWYSASSWRKIIFLHQSYAWCLVVLAPGRLLCRKIRRKPGFKAPGWIAFHAKHLQIPSTLVLIIWTAEIFLLPLAPQVLTYHGVFCKLYVQSPQDSFAP